VVSESGIENSDDIELLMKHSIDAALVGTSLMRSQNIEQKLAKLVTAGNKKGTKRKR
jgi:indole-3-glycerol phosphate synthase